MKERDTHAPSPKASCHVTVESQGISIGQMRERILTMVGVITVAPSWVMRNFATAVRHVTIHPRRQIARVRKARVTSEPHLMSYMLVICVLTSNCYRRRLQAQPWRPRPIDNR
jgi:hypothetical protein